VGFIEVAGQGRETIDKWLKTMGDLHGQDAEVALAQAIREAHGHAMAPLPEAVVRARGAPGGILEATWRGLGALYQGARTMILVPATAKNLLESFSYGMPLKAAIGFKRLAMGGGAKARGAAAAYAATLEGYGAWVRDHTILAVDPRFGISQTIRNFFKLVNEPRKLTEGMQEVGAAAVADYNVELFRSGKGTQADAAFIETMGYSREMAQKMIRGEAPDAIYEQYLTRFPARVQGGTQRGQERSYLENHPVAKAVLTFQSYGQMRARLFARSASNLLDSIKRLGASHMTPREKYDSLQGSVRNFVKLNLSAGVAGIGTNIIMAFLTAGKEEVGRRLREDDLAELLVAGWVQTQVGPPYSSIQQTTQSGRITDVSLPLSILHSAVRAAFGTDEYENMSATESAVHIVERLLPMNRYLAFGMAAIKGRDATELIQEGRARAAYYRWAKKQGRAEFTHTEQSNPAEFEKEYRIQMRLAYKALISGGREGDRPSSETMEEVREHLLAAYQTGKATTGGIAQSLRARKLLDWAKISENVGPKTNEKRVKDWASLQENLSPEDIRRLVLHDQLLEAMAEAVE